MFGNGLEREVIIRVLPRVTQEQPSMFSPGGIKDVDYDRLDVWANKGLTGNFEKIPGVLAVKTQGIENSYMIFVDPRYNLKWVMAEIEAVAKTETPKKKDVLEIKSGWTFSFDWSSMLGEATPEPKPRRKTTKKPAAKKK